MAQIFRHGDDLRSVEKLILIILITHVSFARAALIYKEKSLMCLLRLHLLSPAQQDLLSTNHKHGSKW